jgi:tetratricopeptide (TPR) repeat protein
VPKLLKETEVYVKYGLHEKALEHLRKIFSVEPENPEAHEKAKALALAMNRPADAASSLAMLVKLYGARSDPRAEGARAELRALDPDSAALQSGPAHAASGAASAAASAAVVASAEEEEYEEPVEVGEYVEGELDEAIVEDTDVVFADDELSGDIETDPLDSGPDAGRAGAPAVEDAFASDLAEAEFYTQAGLTEDARAIIEAILLAEPGHAEAQRRLSALSGPIEAAPLPKRTAGVKRSAGASSDLAAELAAELASEGMALVVAEDEGPIEPESLESFQIPVHEVLGEFRAKLQETVRPEDVQTHYDLGIAYKEMGLIDEAVAEFEVALRHGGGVRKADSVTMLGLCAREKGDLEGAAQWFRTGLDEPDLSPPARRALAFELAEIYEALGQQAMALEQYQIVERVEPGFRDVAQRIVHLGGSVSAPQKNGARPPSPKRDASAPPPVAVAPPASVSPVAAAASLAQPAAAGRAAAASAATQPAKAARPADREPEPQANETQAQRRNRKIGFV